MKALYDLAKKEKQNRKRSHAGMLATSSGPPRLGRKMKQTKTHQAAEPQEDDDNHNLCCFCKRVPPAVNIHLAAPTKQRSHQQRSYRAMKPYCLSCYYTTSAIRQDTDKYVSVCPNEDNSGHSTEIEIQLPGIQQLFSEAFLELQKELSNESARAFRQQKKDPLAALLSSGGIGGGNSNGRRMKKPSSPAKAPKPSKSPKGDNNDSNAGGFLRSVPLPERLLKVQQEQAQIHAQQLARMNKAAAGASNDSASTMPQRSIEMSSVYKRRKSSRQSIWNLAMDPATDKAIEKAKNDNTLTTATVAEDATNVPPCTCGSIDVVSFGNITSRNQDMRKGETWGMKDRSDDVVSRYRCNQCGKTWNEES